MKAREIATGKIVEVEFVERKTHTGEQVYMTHEGYLIEESRLDFNVDDTPDYWTRLEHQYAGMAMQGILTQEGALEASAKDVAFDAILYATALVEKLKEKEERK